MKLTDKGLIISVVLLTILLLITSCAKMEEYEDDLSNNESIVSKEEPKNNVVVNPNAEEDEIEKYISNMTIEQKIGQLLMPAFRESKYEIVDQYNEQMKDIIDKYHIGGVVLFKENIKDKEQTKDLIKNLQAESQIPLFIAVDEEGGKVSRISSNPDMGFKAIQSAFEIGEKNDKQLAYDIGKEIASMLTELGFNMDFAPVVDIWSNPKNTVIGTRSYGTDGEIVTDMASEVMLGLQDGNIISVLKHFPGHGDTLEDTHAGRAFLNRSLDELEERELSPFVNMIKKEAEAIMVAHIEVPSIDEGMPASLSHEIMTGLLKDKMGFKGLIITDALDMSAVTSQFSSNEIAVKSFLAGADILLMPDVEESYISLLEAYNNKLISEERLDASVYKIIKTKLRNKIL